MHAAVVMRMMINNDDWDDDNVLVKDKLQVNPTYVPEHYACIGGDSDNDDNIGDNDNKQ